MGRDEGLPACWRDLEQGAFGDTPQMADELLALVLEGKKTATCSALRDHAAEGRPVPKVGERWVVLDGRGRPACVAETSEVVIKRFDEVDAAFAWDEGEGDRSLAPGDLRMSASSGGGARSPGTCFSSASVSACSTSSRAGRRHSVFPA